MKSLAKKLLLIVLSVIMLLSMGMTAFAFSDGGSGGGSGGGGIPNGVNPHYSYIGWKFTLQRRADVLTKGNTNSQAYENGLRGRQGIIVFMGADGSESGFNPSNEYAYVGGTTFQSISNISMSFTDFGNLFGVDGNGLKSAMQSGLHVDGNCFGSGDDYMNWQASSDWLTNTFYKNSDMLYNTTKRAKFYDDFANAMKTFGKSVGVTKEEFMGDEGVLVCEPIVGVHGSCGSDNKYWFATFQTAEAVAEEVGPHDWDTNFNKKNTITKRLFGQQLTAVTNGRFSPMYGKTATHWGMTNAGTVTNFYDIEGKQFRSSAASTDYILSHNGSNWSYGFLVFGTDYEGESKAAANLAIRATQNKDGSFNVDAVASMISQADGNMPVDKDDFKDGTSTKTGITGGQSSNGNNVPTLVSNVTDSWTSGYETYAYGSFLLSSGGKVDAKANLEAMRKNVTGTISAKEQSVSSGDYNAGKTFKPNWKYATPQDTAEYFASSTYKGHVQKRLVQNMVTNGGSIKNLAYNLTAWANNESKTGATDLVATSDKTTAGKGSAEFTGSDNSFGMAVEYLVKYEPIKSFISYGKLTYDEELNGTFTIGENDKVDYNKGTEGRFTVDKPRYLITMVSNCKADDGYRLSDNNRNGQSFWNEVKNSLKQGEVFDLQQFKSIVNKYLTADNITVSGTKKGASVALGSDNGCGYSVFVLEIDVPKTIKATTNIDLQDYQLNFVHQDVLAPIGGILTGSGENVVNPNAVTSKNCVFGSGTHNFYQTRSNLYNLKHSNYSGTTVSADNSSSSSRFILYNTALGNSYTFNQTKGGVSNIPTTDAKRYTYAWDLSRGIYGDVRTISALSGNSIDQNTKNLLMQKHKLIYGIKPDDEGGSPKADRIRDSFGKIYDQVGDTISWKGEWTIGGTAPKDAVTGTHSGIISTSNGNTQVSDTFMSLVESGARPLLYKGASIYELKVDVKETIYKYSTADMGVGSNTKANKNLSTGLIRPASDYTTNTANGSKANNDKGIIYRNAAVSGTDFALKYYPEVRMKAYLVSGDTINGKNSVTPKSVITMAELVRQTKPSSMYLMKLDSSEKTGKQLEGEIYSDTMGAGTNAGNLSKGSGATSGKNNLPVIYGGSDVTLEINPKDVNLHMYGYALDLANYDVDKNGLKYADDATQPYTNIVNDTSSANRDPYSTWGNDGTKSTEKLQTQFNDWVVDVINSLDVDVQLKVSEADSSGNVKTTVAKEYNNFSVSMPKFKADDYKSAGTDGVFNIVVKRGDIDRTATEYKALINQIASDYGCDYATAENLFKESDMYQSIVRSIEDIKDAENKSQNVNTSEDGAHAVRDDNTNTHWYDEEVKTFVVRRYEAKPVKISDIILTDKIDYDVAPDSTAGKGNNKDNAQQKYYKQRVGQWYLSLYLKKPDTGENVNLHFSDTTNYYNPYDFMAKDWDADKNKMLINTLYIDGADFKIASASTMDMLW